MKLAPVIALSGFSACFAWVAVYFGAPLVLPRLNSALAQFGVDVTLFIAVWHLTVFGWLNYGARREKREGA
jgi:hypothetical protein